MLVKNQKKKKKSARRHRGTEAADESRHVLFEKVGRAGARGILFDEHRTSSFFSNVGAMGKKQTNSRRSPADRRLFRGSAVFGSDTRVRRIICGVELSPVSPYRRCRGVWSLEWTPRSRIPLEGGRISQRLAGEHTRLSETHTCLLFCEVTVKVTLPSPSSGGLDIHNINMFVLALYLHIKMKIKCLGFMFARLVNCEDALLFV